MAFRGKKTTAGPSRKPRPDIAPTFVSEAAAERFKLSIVGKRCIQERGFLNPIRSVQTTIQSRNWEQFARHPTAALVPVIREFYANAREHKDFKALVRGKWVPFDKHSINAMYQLPDMLEDDYQALKDAGPDYEEIIQFLAEPGTVWKRSQNTVLHFPLSKMNTASKVWHYFISAKLLPSYHVSGVSRERAVLNFAIQKGLSVDVGKIIHESILSMAQGKAGGGGFGHPSLIYDLCLEAGVMTSAKEELQQPKPAITPEAIRRLDRTEHSSRGRAEVAEEDEPDIGRGKKPMRDHSSSRSSRQSDHSEDKVKAVEEKLMSRMDQYLMRQDQYFQRQEQQFTYILQVQQAIASGSAIPPMPEFTSIPPPYIPQVADSDEEEGSSDHEE